MAEGTSPGSCSGAPSSAVSTSPSRRPGTGGGSVGLEAHHHEAEAGAGREALEGLGERDRLQPHAQVAAAHPAASQQLVEHAAHRRGGHRQLELAREPGGHEPDGRAAGIHERAAREARIEDEVDPQEPIHVTAAPRPPGPAGGADDAPARPRSVPHRERQMPDAERAAVAELGGGPPGLRHAQHGQVGAGIAGHQGGRRRVPVRPRHADVGVEAHGVLGGDDEAGSPHDAGRRQPRTGMHGDDRARGALDGRGQIVGERDERLHGDPPFRWWTHDAPRRDAGESPEWLGR
jgi:hypothetical protein